MGKTLRERERRKGGMIALPDCVVVTAFFCCEYSILMDPGSL